ncbi:hypothetical protein BDFB_001421 [Asbolus verrucosus]|uniref:Uncharacterized protein n=1 Tax=Asbolus verrucosus TaxID=1661398 RepID=A0A482VZ92_ASBVE|nr:hypothetical protein BDFB_001421 [Asbolus verrucosus]
MQTTSLIALFSLVASIEAASVVPIDSSLVNVKHSGQDYSYSINENHGIAIDPLPYHQIPVIQIAPDSNLIKYEHIPIKEQEIKPLQPQMKSAQVAGMAYPVPVAGFPAYSYLPAHQYAIPYPYGINYPYNLIATI